MMLEGTARTTLARATTVAIENCILKVVGLLWKLSFDWRVDEVEVGGGSGVCMNDDEGYCWEAAQVTFIYFFLNLQVELSGREESASSPQMQ